MILQSSFTAFKKSWNAKNFHSRKVFFPCFHLGTHLSPFLSSQKRKKKSFSQESFWMHYQKNILSISRYVSLLDLAELDEGLESWWPFFALLPRLCTGIKKRARVSFYFVYLITTSKERCVKPHFNSIFRVLKIQKCKWFLCLGVI